ncbi:helix-turn-helix domain-containing protein [Actinomadura roseirufa]|uniref:helix-turn-helix domain-containing protein n=1 Tax=Actinomadura roseirufa TaxID=2094049 RepID=UPI001F5EA7BD|nr:helix-turn-helix transcriptional regulator [Actinomadura roseirufa]
MATDAAPEAEDEPRPTAGPRLRAERKRRGWSCAKMARRLAQHVPDQCPDHETLTSYIKRWEAGKVTRISDRYQYALAATFDMTEEDLFAPPAPPLSEPGGAPMGTVEHGSIPDSGDDDVKRRAAIQLIAAISAGTAIPPGTVEIILSGVEDALGNPLDLAEWERIVHEYPRLMDRRPVGAVINGLTADLIAVGQLLKQSHEVSERAGLLRMRGGLAGLLAMDLDGLGERRAAETAWRTAVRAADASGDRNLAVWVRGRQAEVGIFAGRSDLIVSDLADEARQRAGKAPSGGLARAHAATAIMAAEQGNDTAARAALVNCRAVTGKVAGTGQATVVCSGWSEKNMWWTESYAFTLMGDRRAEAALDQALALYPSGTLGPVTNLHLMRAMTMVKNRDIDHGLGYAISSLHEGDATGTVRRHLVRQIVDALPEKARTLPEARELRVLTSRPAGTAVL